MYTSHAGHHSCHQKMLQKRLRIPPLSTLSRCCAGRECARQQRQQSARQPPPSPKPASLQLCQGQTVPLRLAPPLQPLQPPSPAVKLPRRLPLRLPLRLLQAQADQPGEAGRASSPWRRPIRLQMVQQLRWLLARLLQQSLLAGRGAGQLPSARQRPESRPGPQTWQMSSLRARSRSQ